MTATLPSNLATGDLIAEVWMDAVAACLAELQPAALPTAWTAPTLLNSWVVWGAGSFQIPQYRKIGDMVQMRGSVKGGTIPSVILTLPVGHRPPNNILVPIVAASTAAYVVVGSDGTVNFPSVGGWTNSNVSLCCSFSVTP